MGKCLSGYRPLNLPASLVEELKIWRMDFGISYGRTVAYAEMIRLVLHRFEGADSRVVAAFDDIIIKHPELIERIMPNVVNKEQ